MLQSARASAPMARDFSWSEVGYQVQVEARFGSAFVVCQTPPPAVPSQTSNWLYGFHAIDVARPFSPPEKKQQEGAGPIGNQVVPQFLAWAGRMAARNSADATSAARDRWGRAGFMALSSS